MGPAGPPGPPWPTGFATAANPENPRKHGAGKDPRYPSPRTLRRVLSFTFDLLLHFAAAVGIFYTPHLGPLITVNAAVAWLLASFVDRVLVQWAFRASIGKLLFGLCVVRPTDGGRVGFGELAKAWLISVWTTILFFGELGGSSGGSGPDLDRDWPAVVRRRDARALPTAPPTAIPTWPTPPTTAPQPHLNPNPHTPNNWPQQPPR